MYTNYNTTTIQYYYKLTVTTIVIKMARKYYY